MALLDIRAVFDLLAYPRSKREMGSILDELRHHVHIINRHCLVFSVILIV